MYASCMLHQLQRKADESLKKQIEERLKFMLLKLENFENSEDDFVFVVNDDRHEILSIFLKYRMRIILLINIAMKEGKF